MPARLNICIVGGGNSSHSLIPLLYSAGHDISLLTSNPQKWGMDIAMEYTDKDGRVKDVLHGKLKVATSDPSKVIPDADVIILSLPVSAYRILLNKIAPFVNKNRRVFVGTIYGQGGFNWMMEQVIRDYALQNIEYFAIGLLPWITRTKEYGKVGINYGSKHRNVVALSNMNEFTWLNDALLNDLCHRYFKKGKFELSDTFLALTLSVDNQIIHLSRLYGLYLRFGGSWNTVDSVPLFYRDFDDMSAEIMGNLDSDYSKIRQKIINKHSNIDFKYMLDYLLLERFSYDSCNTDIKDSFTSSETLGQIPTPTVIDSEGRFIFDKNHRFFKDDLYYGLVIAKWFAEKLDIEDTPTLNQIIGWAQNVLGDLVMIDNRLVKPIEDSQYKNGNPDIYKYSSYDDYVS